MIQKEFSPKEADGMLRQQVLALILACFLLGFSPAPGWGRVRMS